VAAELSVGSSELVLTELLLGGAFADMGPDALAATCSCFVWSERTTTPTR
jgi:ATP-dependent RNA helicase DOB1